MVLLNLELAVQLCWLASQPQRSTTQALGLQMHTTMLEFYMGTRNLNSDPLLNLFFMWVQRIWIQILMLAQ